MRSSCPRMDKRNKETRFKENNEVVEQLELKEQKKVQRLEECVYMK